MPGPILLHLTPKCPSRHASTVAAEDTRIVHPLPADLTSTRRRESCHSTTRTVPQAESLFAIIYRWASISLYMGSFDPFLYSRRLTLYSGFPSFTLAFCHRTLSNPLRPCARRLSFGYNSPICLQFEQRFLVPTLPRGSVAGKTPTYSFPFPLTSPLYSLCALDLLFHCLALVYK